VDAGYRAVEIHIGGLAAVLTGDADLLEQWSVITLAQTKVAGQLIDATTPRAFDPLSQSQYRGVASET
jgi:hypothetical protein